MWKSIKRLLSISVTAGSRKYVTIPLFILISILVAGPDHYTTDKEFVPYIEDVKILSEGNLGVRNIKIGFGTGSKKLLGYCALAWREITVNKSNWKKLDHRSRILLIAHELAHCSGKSIEHINGLDQIGCTEHFMHKSSMGKWCNLVNYKKYIEQMKVI